MTVVGLIVVGAGIFFVLSGTLFEKQEVSNGDPIDVVYDLYSPWLEAAQSTTTDPYQEELGKYPLMSKELRSRLSVSHEGLDPVLCQTTVPARISMRRVSGGGGVMQVLVTAKSPATSTEQALVTLRSLEGGWYIDDIKCSPGEFVPEKEFSFDMLGELVKKVSPPLDPQYWHLMFDESDASGKFVPLFFSASSTCQSVDESNAVCNPNAFMENSKAHVKGGMTEKGVEVKQIEFR
jgi:hypothetical protein